MTINKNIFYKVPVNSYVLLHNTKESIMLSSLGVSAEEESEDWIRVGCSECFDEPPPTFFLPPPPCPPSIDLPSLGDFLRDGGDDPPSSCPAFMGAREDVPQGEKIPLAAVAITAVISVLLVTMIACIIYRVRINKKRPSKSSPPTDGAIVYDDLTPSLQPITRGHHPPHILWGPPVVGPPSVARFNPPRYTQTPSIQRLHDAHSKGGLVGVMGGYEISLSSSEGTPSAPPPSEPLYHTISSASGSGSERCSSEARGPFCTSSPRRCPTSDSDEDDSSTPFIAGTAAAVRLGPSSLEDRHSSSSPSQAKYYLSVPLDAFRPPSISTLASSNEYETLPLRGGLVGTTGRPLTPQERGLPPLPSRSERFRMFLPHERNRAPAALQELPVPTRQHRKGPTYSHSRGRNRGPLLHHKVLYENIVPSSNL